MGFGAATVVEGQPRVGLPYGLFSVLSFRSSSDPHWVNGIEWESMVCDPASAIIDPGCDPDEEDAVFFTDMNDTGEASSFAVYGTSKCGGPGGSAFQDGQASAEALLLAREEQQAERVVWEKSLAPAATDINPGGALSPQSALAALEGWMGGTYGSLGVIHAPRRAASLLSGLHRKDGRLLTNIDSPVAAGGGYPGTSPTGQEPAAGELWVFASPALFGYRGSVFTSRSYAPRTNNMYALAARQYVVGFDPCGVAAVRMTV